MENASGGVLNISEEGIACKILHIRGERVILDFHLAELYQTEIRILKQSVKRNSDRFPEDFMFELSINEMNALVSQNVIPSKSVLGGSIPYAFTETGVAMLSSVLRSKQAVMIHIAIMRAFVFLRRRLNEFNDLKIWQQEIEGRLGESDSKFMLIFEYLKQFEELKRSEDNYKNRPRIGYSKST
jgi:hypothetical protein